MPRKEAGGEQEHVKIIVVSKRCSPKGMCVARVDIVEAKVGFIILVAKRKGGNR